MTESRKGEGVLARWFLGSLNDGLFIVNRRPTPCGTDLAVGAPNPDPATVVLNITELPDAKAQEIVDAHNATVAAVAELIEAAEIATVNPQRHRLEGHALDVVMLPTPTYDRLRLALTKVSG